MLSLARLARLQFPFLFGGAFIEALRAAHPCLRGKHFNLPYNFVGTFPNLFLLRSWTRHSPGTELFLFAAQEATRPKHQPQTPPASCYLPPPHLQAENSTRRNSVINSLISQNTPPWCYPQNQAAKADCPPYSLTPRRH